MTKFNTHPGYVQLYDGPGKGQQFYVQRAPVFLRVVCDQNSKWDILDLIEDEPTNEEEIHVYRQLRWMHARADDRSKSGVYYTYIYIPVSGTQKATLRHTNRWREWTTLMATELERQTA